MKFHLADTFTAAYDQLNGQEQKAVKASVFDLQLDPSGRGLRMHRIDNSNDPNFWSLRVNRDVRLIVHKTGDSLLVAYVDHHDKAYAWAERRRIEAHPKTGAIQIVEVRERVEEIAPPAEFDFVFAAESAEPAAAEAHASPRHFGGLEDDALLDVGVPRDWLADVRAADEDAFFTLAQHLPSEAAEALLEYAATGRFPQPAVPETADPYAHPDTQRRIRLIADSEELEQALEYPWEKWGVFLHPSQRSLVERDFAGPARVAGSAGTGKTVVAIHRAVRLARENPDARVLLATFSDPLAEALERKVTVLAPETGSVVPRIKTASFRGIASELFQLEFGAKPRIASDKVIRQLVSDSAKELGVSGFSERFLVSEWANVIDAWGIGSCEEYIATARMGRKSRLGPKQRERLWPLFAKVRAELSAAHYLTWADVFTQLAVRLAEKDSKPFDHILIDEAQDLGPAELRFFAAITEGENSLFFAGDLGQRIFQHPYSWKSLGVDVRGRSYTLKVCYRTSQQIRRSADNLLPISLRDGDGLEDERAGTISVFEGPQPIVSVFPDEQSEADAVCSFVQEALADGIGPSEIGIFVRLPELVVRANAAIASIPGVEPIKVANMHLAKGLEFRAVVVLACDEGVLPWDGRIADAADEAELDDIYETERRLLYVACTRARERLLITATTPGSEYLADLAPSGHGALR
jgi:hypothetical protein